MSEGHSDIQAPAPTASFHTPTSADGCGFLIDINMLDGPQMLKAPDLKMSVMISFFISPRAVDSSNM